MLDLARKILESKEWQEGGYTLKELFEIRDALVTLSKYNLEDRDLLMEVNKYIHHKISE